MRVEVFGLGQLSADGNDVPVAVILTPKDKENIASMHPDATIYCVYPDSIPPDRIQVWLDDLKGRTP